MVGKGGDDRGSGSGEESRMIRLCASPTDWVWLGTGRWDGGWDGSLCGRQGGTGREVVRVDE